MMSAGGRGIENLINLHRWPRRSSSQNFIVIL